MTKQISPSVERVLRRLGANISQTRRRRRWSQHDMAEQIGVSVSTVRRLEAGDPGVAAHHLVSSLIAFGAMDQLNDLLASCRDDIGLLIQDRELPERIRSSTPNER